LEQFRMNRLDTKNNKVIGLNNFTGRPLSKVQD